MHYRDRIGFRQGIAGLQTDDYRTEHPLVRQIIDRTEHPSVRQIIDRTGEHPSVDQITDQTVVVRTREHRITDRTVVVRTREHQIVLLQTVVEAYQTVVQLVVQLAVQLNKIYHTLQAKIELNQGLLRARINSWVSLIQARTCFADSFLA